MDISHQTTSHVHDSRLLFTVPTVKVEEERSINILTRTTTVAPGKLLPCLFRVVFYSHLCLITILVIVLTIRGIISTKSSHHHDHFHPEKWYPPLLASIAISGLVSFIWQWITAFNPSKAIRLAFWLSPLLSCSVGILLVAIDSKASLGLGVIAIVFSLIVSLYACWVNPRFEYAIRVLSVSTSFPPPKTNLLVSQSMFTSILYASFLVGGIGGARATRTGLDALFITLILLSLAWTMQVIKNIMFVTISRIKHLNFTLGLEMDTVVAFYETMRYLMGSICIGSVLVPFLTVIRGSARAMNLVAGDTDEFMFSCADCYSGLASALISRGNRWGFVHVGVFGKGFVQASFDTWEMFKRGGLEGLIDSDLTGVFCFLCGVGGGAVCCLGSGIWVLVIHRSYATEVTIFAFLIGYFLCRIGMAWPQACVSAYYVAYAENPQNVRFDSTIPARIQELRRRSQV